MTTTLKPQSPQDLAAVLAEGQRLLATDPEAAARQARLVLSTVPHSPDAHRLLGAALRRTGDDERANEAEMAAIAASGNDPDLRAAGDAMMANDLPRAEHIVRQVLAARPNDAAAIRMLGEIASEVGFPRDAEQLFRQALDLAPGFDFARLHLAMVLDQQNRSGEALAELDRITGEIRDYPEARNLRAAVLGRTGGYEEAIELYSRSLEEDPGNVQLRLSLAYLQQIVGDEDSSIATYRKVIAQAPTAGEAWWGLANMKTIRFTPEDVDAMRSALADPGLSEEDRLHLAFALGKALEDRGEDEESFRCYAEGNSIRALQLSHDPAMVTSLVERMEKVFSASFLSSHATAGSESADPIFVLGMPRSGSTLVDQILASHPMVEGTAELPDIIVLARSLESDDRRSAGKAWKDYPEIVERLEDDELRRLGDLYVERTRSQRKTDRPRFVDKMPNNWIHLGFIRAILPKAKIIDTRRNPLACGFSNFKQNYARGQEFSYDLQSFGQYYRDYVRLMRHFDEVAPGAVHRVIHERLVADPEAEVRRLLDYLGLPFDEACLSFHETRRPIRTASAQQVRRPISADSVDQWRRFERWLDPLKAGLGPALEHWED